MNGTIFIAFGSHCDFGPWHGWLFAYDAATLTQKSVYVTTPNGGMGGFWMSGAGVAGDSNGNIYIPSGNGDFDSVNVPARETGDTLLKLGTTNQILTQLDYFTPQDQQTLDNNDIDLGSGGALLLPDQPVLPTHSGSGWQRRRSLRSESRPTHYRQPPLLLGMLQRHGDSRRGCSRDHWWRAILEQPGILEQQYLLLGRWDLHDSDPSPKRNSGFHPHFKKLHIYWVSWRHAFDFFERNCSGHRNCLGG